MAKKLAPTRRKVSSSPAASRPQRSSAPNHQLMKLVAIALFLALAFVSLKYFLAKKSWMSYGTQAQDKILNEPTRSSIDDASTVAATVLNFPEGSPLWKQPKMLQNYVDVLSTHTDRDVVIVDENGVILADTVPANVGQKWAQDKESEVMMTIQDGKPRNFEEKSQDYPAGIMQVVVPVRDASGKIFGAVIYSTETTP